MALEQPTVGEANQSRKSCWGCDEWTPYNVGFCSECWSLLPEGDQQVYVLALGASPSIGGAVRVACSQLIKDIRRPKRPYTPVFERPQKKVKRKLPDINLSLGDLEL